MVEELNSRRPRNNSTFPVIIIETVADFCAPFPFNVDFADDFMPKQTHETNIGGSETCIGETTQIILCFPEVFQQNMTGIVASSPRGTQRRADHSPTLPLGRCNETKQLQWQRKEK